MILFLSVINLKVNAQGNINIINTSKTSLPINSINYLTFSSYGITISKLDGSFINYSISNINSINFKNNETSVNNILASNSNKLNVYPNPVIDNLFIEFNSEENNDIFISVIDINGRTIIKEKYSCNQGINNLTINTSNLQKGMYLCTITNSSDINSKIFIKD
jgi:hypothetical protein